MMGGYGYTGGMAGYGWLMMLIFWVALIVAVAWAVRAYISRYNGPLESTDEILSRRFARGELSRDEFEQARTAIHAAKN